MTAQLPLALPVPTDAIAWLRYPTACRADYHLTVGGKSSGVWVRDCGHPTALRPYYILLPGGRVIERKFSLLADAKVMAISEWKELQK